MGKESLAPLREELAAIDREIVALVGRRNGIAKIIGEEKAKANEEVVVPAVERVVEQRYVDAGVRAGVSAATAVRLARAVIDESVEVQGRLPRHAEPRRICIVGGNGGMGRWLSAFFAARGHEVMVVVRDPENAVCPVVTLAEACRMAEVIVVSTPVTTAAGILEEIFASRTSALVFDILSVKSPVIPVLRRMAEAGMRVCSVHPMFGPTAAAVAGRNIVVADCGCPSVIEEAAALFSGGTILRMPVEDHDPIAAYVLGLSHAVNLAFSEALVRSGFSAEVLNAAASTTFRRQTAVSLEVSEENAPLYYAIQRENPYNDAAVKNLADAVSELRVLEKDAFCKRMQSGAAWYRTE
ncbi:prephenate dehydrogenase/arogenate dehydrogenase family protein [Methanocorpusculum vombati]|uniref:Prephenate dehydrogenase/arogenate dehydrogenase family protein n=1 Tax=Methanocorpusculum vombati TaxID=3002864 RepID=A0ABT4IR19_9EURY|nr:prephenate dehydrogenase/arogenate dehydrogenase family protein [Methanocorpusculum vombati]MCZ9319020.1 prephenate dehydrogenase/arogenate dehydrogenase family protein [Methanocorpusculum sp.]MCZ0863553.1 prephenate dehydrogenase/arogenate dehydrogenase family protein [Methanocorpusculum vombati]MDE2519896.1 prephenate dehydrogenase/arogenate dehydrogenase family protein [Methanocorpusculum sp.]MDE2546151.1 prephenate dehydrogenase/arogenate dehydrogenase family protein [Methanocorpusculum 